MSEGYGSVRFISSFMKSVTTNAYSVYWKYILFYATKKFELRNQDFTDGFDDFKWLTECVVEVLKRAPKNILIE